MTRVPQIASPVPGVGHLRRSFFYAVILLSIPGFLALRNFGKWLALDEPLTKSQAIVVLGGQVPFRAMEAANLYREGWAPEVWLTHGEPTAEAAALARIGFDEQGEDQISRAVLLKLGVPPTAIRLLPDAVESTLAEVRLASGYSRPGATVIVVTSKSHARRVRMTWNAAGSGRAAIVRYASEDPFDSVHWWRTSTDVLSMTRESLGIVNAWLGFPLNPRKVTVR
jgi:uncharacterized SAM-binding protein YcdF (DUF218 family)